MFGTSSISPQLSQNDSLYSDDFTVWPKDLSSSTFPPVTLRELRPTFNLQSRYVSPFVLRQGLKAELNHCAFWGNWTKKLKLHPQHCKRLRISNCKPKLYVSNYTQRSKLSVLAELQHSAMALLCLGPSSPCTGMLIHLRDAVHVTAKCCADCGREESLVVFKITLNKSRRLVVLSPRVTSHNAWRRSLRHAQSVRTHAQAEESRPHYCNPCAAILMANRGK